MTCLVILLRFFTFLRFPISRSLIPEFALGNSLILTERPLLNPYLCSAELNGVGVHELQVYSLFLGIGRSTLISPRNWIFTTAQAVGKGECIGYERTKHVAGIEIILQPYNNNRKKGASCLLLLLYLPPSFLPSKLVEFHLLSSPHPTWTSFHSPFNLFNLL